MTYEFKKGEEVYIFHHSVNKKKFLFKTRIATDRLSRGCFSFVLNYFNRIIKVAHSKIFKHGCLDNKFFGLKKIYYKKSKRTYYNKHKMKFLCLLF